MVGERLRQVCSLLREMCSVLFFLSSGVTRACLNAGGKMPMWRHEFMMCVRAGRSVGEIAWSRCDVMGSRGQVVG